MTHTRVRDAGTGRRRGRSPAPAVALAALVWLLVPPGTSPAWASGACPTLDDGVTVVVDFQHLGGGAVVRCAPGDPSSGLAALDAAGFRVDQVANQPGFVCRIDGLPGPADEDCADTPPAKAYWGYSYAQRGGSWNYSGSGAHVRDPAVGTVEGWAFNGGGGSTQPTIAPPPPPAEPQPSPSPSPSPASSVPSSGRASEADGGQTSAGSDEGSSGGRGSSSAPAATDSDGADDGADDGDPVAASTPPEPETTASAAATPTDRPSPTATDGPPTAVPAGTSTPEPSGTATAAGALGAGDVGGTPWATLAGALLIAAVLAAAALVRRRGVRADGG